VKIVEIVKWTNQCSR